MLKQLAPSDLLKLETESRPRRMNGTPHVVRLRLVEPAQKTADSERAVPALQELAPSKPRVYGFAGRFARFFADAVCFYGNCCASAHVLPFQLLARPAKDRDARDY